MPTSINSFDSSEIIPPSQSRWETGSQMNVSRYSTFGTIIRIGGRNLEKSRVLSEKSSNSVASFNSAASSKSGEIAAIPRSNRSSAVMGIKRMADAPGWSTPITLYPRSASTPPKAKKRKTESIPSPLIPAKTYGKKDRKSEPLSTCAFDIDEAEELVGTYKFFMSKGKKANKENKPAETTPKGNIIAENVSLPSKGNNTNKGNKLAKTMPKGNIIAENVSYPSKGKNTNKGNKPAETMPKGNIIAENVSFPSKGKNTNKGNKPAKTKGNIMVERVSKDVQTEDRAKQDKETQTDNRATETKDVQTEEKAKEDKEVQTETDPADPSNEAIGKLLEANSKLMEANNKLVEIFLLRR